MRAVVFSGTSDGRYIAEYLNSKKINTTVCVASEYGSNIMPPMPFVKVHWGRLDVRAMHDFVCGADFVIDATHPYATEVTKNIRAACGAAGVEYVRLLRDKGSVSGNVTTVPSIDAAVDYLADKDGMIFVSTGSKELEKYCPLGVERLVARVLPAEPSRQKCSQLGIKNVIYGMGPFDEEQNLADFRHWNTSWLVTKNSGREGGFYQKISAAKRLNMGVIVIERPMEKDGMPADMVKKYIDDRLLRSESVLDLEKTGVAAGCSGALSEEKNCGDLRFPMFISLRHKPVLVVGAGKIGTRRIRVLLDFGARVRVVSPQIADEDIIDKVEYIKREFEEGDVCGMLLAVGATDDRAVNHRVYKACMKQNIPVSIADCREECTFFFPAVCTAQNISVGVASDGENHRLVRETAKKIRGLLNNEDN